MAEGSPHPQKEIRGDYGGDKADGADAQRQQLDNEERAAVPDEVAHAGLLRRRDAHGAGIDGVSGRVVVHVRWPGQGSGEGRADASTTRAARLFSCLGEVRTFNLGVA